ncbi:hypothetical protein ACP4OV_002990 [Aristida adscensionis]
MQRLSLGSPAARPRAAPEAEEAEADEKAAKAAAAAAAAGRGLAPDKSIHLIPVLTLLCFLVLFLLSRDPAALTDSPVLAAAAVAATARSLEATAEATTSVSGRVGVYRRLKGEDAAAQARGRRLGRTAPRGG